MSEILGKLPEDLVDFEEQQDLVDFGNQVSGIVQDMGIYITQKGDRNIKYVIKVTDKVPSEHVDEVHNIYHNWAKKDNDEGYPIIYKYSQARLAIMLMQKELGTTRPADIIGQHVLFERHSMRELPDIDKSGIDLSNEQPRLYPVKFLK